MAALRLRRAGTWTYGKNTPDSSLLNSMADDLGYPPSWGNTALLPAFGGQAASAAWADLGVKGRESVGGLPCEIVHGDAGRLLGGVGNNCYANTAVRGGVGFLEAIAIYAPVGLL